MAGTAGRRVPGVALAASAESGEDPRSCAVNAHSRTHDVQNLYITGGSVFTTGGDSNPTLTIVALAHRLADTLKRAASSSKKDA